MSQANLRALCYISFHYVKFQIRGFEKKKIVLTSVKEVCNASFFYCIRKEISRIKINL
jgi:hypothetical protein